MTNHIRRREFITLLGVAAAAWPTAVWAQRGERVRRIGVLNQSAADDSLSMARIAAFHQGLQQLGWTVGQNVQIEYRWGSGDANRYRRYAAELIELMPDVILVSGSTNVGPLLELTKTVPIVFVQVTDPVGAGLVDSLARPGGNATGFANIEYGISAKWLELLKEIAPHVTRVGVLRDATIASGIGQFAAIQSAAPSLKMEVTPIGLRDAGEIERSITSFSRGANSGLIVVSNARAIFHRDLIVALAARHRLPTVYSGRPYVDVGGLISYGIDGVAPYRQAAGYVDRILKGEKPADLPVQAPTKFQTVLNMKTAKALGLQVPDIVLVRADEVIE
jgi:putative tryptophan/tyrosine transport system substrate-binding protein